MTSRARAFFLLTLLLATAGACREDALTCSGQSCGGTIACNDGTGATDCCADQTIGMCQTEGLDCWTACAYQPATPNEGLRGHKVCGGGQWAVGLGLFPCSRTAPDGGGADRPAPPP